MTRIQDLGGTPEEIGRAVAGRHRSDETVDPTLDDYVERAHAGGWSLRSALVRYAQPEPVRAAAVLELTRRVDSGLEPHQRLVERRPRLSDLARAHDALGEEYPAMLDAYLLDGDPLDDEESELIPVLALAAALDDLGAVVARWAVEAADDTRPDAEVDRVCHSVAAHLDELGVERQDWYR